MIIKKALETPRFISNNSPEKEADPDVSLRKNRYETGLEITFASGENLPSENDKCLIVHFEEVLARVKLGNSLPQEKDQWIAGKLVAKRPGFKLFFETLLKSHKIVVFSNISSEVPKSLLKEAGILELVHVVYSFGSHKHKNNRENKIWSEIAANLNQTIFITVSNLLSVPPYQGNETDRVLLDLCSFLHFDSLLKVIARTHGESRSIQNRFDDYVNDNNPSILDEPTASFIKMESKSSFNLTANCSTAGLDLLMEAQKAVSQTPFQEKLRSMGAKEAMVIDIATKKTYQMEDIDEAPESTENSSDSKEQSDCLTPTLQFSPSVQKLRSYKNLD